MHPHMRPIKSGVPALNAMKAPQLQIPQTQQTQVHAGAQPSRNGHSAPNAQFSPSQSQPYGAARPPSPVRTNQASHLQTPRSQMQTGSQAQAMARGPQPGHQTGAHTQGQVGAKSPFASHRPAPPIHAQQPQLLPKPASSYGAWMESGGGGAAISTDWERGRASPAPFPKFHEEKTAGSPHLVASPAPMRITQAAPRHMVESPGWGMMAVVDDPESPDEDQDVRTLQAARSFGQADRHHKAEKRLLIASLNNSTASPSLATPHQHLATNSPRRLVQPSTPQTPAAAALFPQGGEGTPSTPFTPREDDVTRALHGLAPGGGRTVLEMAQHVYASIGGLLVDALDRSTHPSVRFTVEGEQGERAGAASGAKATVGVLLMKDEDRCIVGECVPGSPAHLSGKLKRGDLITGVDDGGSSKAELLARVRGVDTPGTSVTLTVERAGKKRPIEVTLIRADATEVARRRAG
ncbi:hypothetical protein T484DRAFT_1789896, partial [Baffinella frigidus]